MFENMLCCTHLSLNGDLVAVVGAGDGGKAGR